MQQARNTFYVTLRDRLAALNAQRTVVVRGLSRPGLLVLENELVSAQEIPDVFCLRWTGLRVHAQQAPAMAMMQCEIRYATEGTAEAGGMDRGTALSVMDAELLGVLTAEPTHVAKTNYGVTPAVALGTDVFWGEPVFQAAVVNEERLSRTATVEVWGYLEAGDL